MPVNTQLPPAADTAPSCLRQLLERADLAVWIHLVLRLRLNVLLLAIFVVILIQLVGLRVLHFRRHPGLLE